MFSQTAMFAGNDHSQGRLIHQIGRPGQICPWLILREKMETRVSKREMYFMTANERHIDKE